MCKCLCVIYSLNKYFDYRFTGWLCARFESCEREARSLLSKKLPIPAYDQLLKMSHSFNIMDARGSVGVTERANCFGAMRALARDVSGDSCH